MPAHAACAVSLQEEIEVVEEQKVLRLRRGGNYHSLPSLRGSYRLFVSFALYWLGDEREKGAVAKSGFLFSTSRNLVGLNAVADRECRECSEV